MLLHPWGSVQCWKSYGWWFQVTRKFKRGPWTRLNGIGSDPLMDPWKNLFQLSSEEGSGRQCETGELKLKLSSINRDYTRGYEVVSWRFYGCSGLISFHLLIHCSFIHISIHPFIHPVNIYWASMIVAGDTKQIRHCHQVIRFTPGPFTSVRLRSWTHLGCLWSWSTCG